VADHLDQLIAGDEPHKAKALLRLLIEELRVKAGARFCRPAASPRPGLRNVRKVELIDRCANRLLPKRHSISLE
jgi:ATP-dependent DNA ligase